MTKHAMVIDDSPTIRMSVEYAIKNLGVGIIQAENGADALKKLSDSKEQGKEVVLFIVDLNMPVMDGITFVKELRKIDRFVPALILTTESEEKKIKEGKDAGASGWLVKPFYPADFTKIVSKYIR